ncbi:hypothetical protein DSM104299_05494 [Baekduia alba]|uniref:ArsR/SmtB family transcription factor n=1 Tax=Baekduia alba TaxID=2997333 RepID=UPI0023412B7C|nr:DUF5937 family protein [Baekduia alba]WCB96728.1 hypothetical protein DSM104299_05494 [Baekduia alba]
MLILQFEREDLAATRFAISPMQEVVTSLQRRGRRGLNPVTTAWEAEIDDRLTGMDTELLDALVSPRGWIPDFLSPFPDTADPPLALELAQLRATAPQRLRTDLEASYLGAALPAVLERGLRAPAVLLDDVCATVAAYHRAALDHLWPRIRAVVRADVAHWSHILITEGLGALLAQLHPAVAWDGRGLAIDVAPELDLTVDVAGRRLPLVPSVFARHPVVNISGELPPVLVYPARGAAAVWDTTPGAPAELAALLGRGRADVLSALDTPRATVDLATLLEVTPGAVSQHLQILARGGLVDRARQGRRVVYRRSELGDRLVSRDARDGGS